MNTVELPPRVLNAELPAKIFDARSSIPLMHQVVNAQMAAARQGTHSTKTRGQVSGTGQKPHRQKGTGRARQGSRRSPQFSGGGAAHGPQPQNYHQRTPKKMKAAALRGALSDRARNNRIHVVTTLIDGTTPSTKEAARALRSITNRSRVLVVTQGGDGLTWLSLRNLPGVHVITWDQLNTYDVLLSDDVIFTESAFTDYLSFEQSRVGHGFVGELSPTPQVSAVDTRQHATLASHVIDFAEIEGAVRTMTNVNAYYSTADPEAHLLSITSDGFEAVVLQTFEDYVQVSWPSTLSAKEAVGLIFELVSEPGMESPSICAIYASGASETWLGTLNKPPSIVAEEVVQIQLDAPDESLMWRRPLPDEQESRFVVYERTATAMRIGELSAATTRHPVKQVLDESFMTSSWIVEPTAAP